MTVLKSVLWTFFISMVPVVELRGAIPIGVANGLPPLAAMLIAICGNMVPVPFIILFIRHVFAWMRTWKVFRPLVEKLENRAEKKKETVRKYASIGLCILVAIPLPGTGAWTGALVAAFMDLRLKNSLPAITLGVIIAGIITTLVTYGFVHLLG